MSIHQDRLLALRQDKPLQKSAQFSFKIVQRLGSKFHLIITGVLIFSLLVGNMAVSAANSLDSAQNKLPEWERTLRTLNDLSLEQQSQSWEVLKQDIAATITPSLTYIGLDGVVRQDIDRTIDLISEWYEAGQNLLDYEFNQSGLQYIGPGERFFTDDLEYFFNQAEDLLPKTQRTINSMWYYRLGGRLLLNSEINAALDAMNVLMELLDSVVQNKDQILRVLGHTGRQTYLVFNQNNGEARPSGGFIGSFITVDLIKGEMEIEESKSIYLADDNKGFPLITHPSISQLNSAAAQPAAEGGLRNLNYFACYPELARMMQREWSQLNNNPIDSNGVIMLSSQLLVDLIPANYTINVPGYGVFNSENILLDIDRITSGLQDDADQDNLKRSLSPILTIFLTQLPDIVNQFGVVNFVSRIVNSIQARNLQIWFENEYIQSLLSQYGFDGGATCGNQNAISPLHINMTADKRDNITINNYAISSQPVWGGQEITVTYNQIVPKSIYLPRGFNEVTGKHYFGLQLPSEAWDISVTSPQEYSEQGVLEFYDLYIQERYGREGYIPEEYQIMYDSMSEFDGGHTYLQPDGTRVAGTIFWTKDEVSEVEISFKIPHSQFKNIEFIGQPGVNDPQVSLGDGLRFVDYTDSTTKNRFEIQKGLEIDIL